MTILARLLKLLRFLESLLDLLDFLVTPVGAIVGVTLGLYAFLVVLTGAPSTAMTLSGSVALILACILTKPEF